ncbi:hypothetical protein CYMTET_8041, partial [Cymbomonas tetramitiformis]
MDFGIFAALDTIFEPDQQHVVAQVDEELKRPEVIPATAPAGYDWAGGTLQICVSNPKKAGSGLDSHIVYFVRSWNTLTQYKFRQNLVQRRYGDFEWIRKKLCEANPGIIIPPLPPKSMVAQDDPSHAAVQERMAQLDVFFSQVVAHPLLRLDPTLQRWLESSKAEMSSWYERGAIGDSLSLVGGLVGEVFDPPPKGIESEMAATLQDDRLPFQIKAFQKLFVELSCEPPYQTLPFQIKAFQKMF